MKSLVTMRMMHCSLNVSMIDYQHEMSDNTFYTVKMIKYINHGCAGIGKTIKISKNDPAIEMKNFNEYIR